MEELMLMTMATCQKYAKKQAITTLTEYEMLMYEGLCELTRKWSKIQQLCMDSRIRTLSQEDITEKSDHQKWLEANGGGDGEPQSP